MEELKHSRPADIEKTSMSIITKELWEQGIELPEQDVERAVLLRTIHTSADFDYARNLVFVNDGARVGAEFFSGDSEKKQIVTDTNMALSGVSKSAAGKLSVETCCFMADPEVAALAKERQVTRATVSMEIAGNRFPKAVFASGNAPTALISLSKQIENGLRPTLVIGVPVGFVNVVESKEQLKEVCEHYGVPAIIAMGRKGGSTIATSILNALLYTATDWVDPEKRGWK